MGGTQPVARALGWAVAAAAGALALAIAGPLAVGARPHTVLTGSMEPAISPGDVVVAERIAPLEAAPGDVAMFRDPADQDRTIVHRVVRLRRDGAHVRFLTRGDANAHGERWRVAADGSIGRVAYTVPLAGHAAALAGRIGPGLLLALALAALVADELWRIWRPRREEEGDRAAA